MKTVCIYHSIDLDGWMSAAIVKHWFKKNNKDFIKDTDSNFCDFVGYNYGDPIPDLSEYDKVIIVDITLGKEMYKLSPNRGFNNTERVIWIDHHKSAIEDSYTGNYSRCQGIRDTNFAACELTWQYFFPNEPMPEIVRLLGRYDCFGHKGTDEEQKITEFQYGARSVIANYEEAYDYLMNCLDISYRNYEEMLISDIHNKGKAIYQYLCTEAQQVYNNKFDIHLPNNEEIPNCYIFACINKERFNPSNFNIDYHKDGYDGVATFYYTGKHWSFSFYSDTVDCSVIAKQYGGGGHKGAAGFIVKNEDIVKFLNQ